MTTDAMRQIGGNPPVNTNVQEVVNTGKNPFFEKPDLTIAEEWLARVEKVPDTARILNSLRLLLIEHWLLRMISKSERMLIQNHLEHHHTVDKGTLVKGVKKIVGRKIFKALYKEEIIILWKRSGKRSRNQIVAHDNYGRGNLQRNAEKPGVQGRAYALEFQVVRDTSRVIEDHPSHFLVPIKLNGANYPSWSKSMIHALTAKTKLASSMDPLSNLQKKDQPTEYALWNQCNSMILSWLTHSVEPDLAKGVIHAKTAYQVWEDFKDQFSQKNAPAIYQIKKSLASFSQGTMTVSTYFTKLKGLWDELDTYRALPTCNQMKARDDQREEDRLMQFLMGLHDTYNVVRTNIPMMSPLPNVQQSYSLVIQEETQ
ncbi:hypothetical protein RJ639_037116 [Escallonia herrerae]|uniref:Retrotransposon Copia-like N-terminal domain-containing protein n=1 Tax=Escallonia herrerae TaxID=1293975 RepID=A0AA88X408_9ASTE|nr:hypothetical protein RJ639_037116 [Escallonia herrerae]